jgi:hypothetical protein
MKPFDYEAFKAGAIALTRCGHEVRYMGALVTKTEYVVCAAIKIGDAEIAVEYTKQGLCSNVTSDRYSVVAMKPVETTLYIAVNKQKSSYGNYYNTSAAEENISALSSLEAEGYQIVEVKILD